MARFLFTSAIAIVASLSLFRPGFGQDAIDWMTDLQAAQNAAARQGKLVLVHFYADDCRPCKTLEKNVFSQAEIAATISRNYVPVKVHVDSLPQLATRYHVQAWPTDLILNPAGLEVYRTISPQSPAQYQTMLDQIAFQSGVGAGRAATNPLEQAPWRGGPKTDVALTGATAPMGQSAGASPGGQVAQQDPYAAPPYSEYTVGGAPPPAMPPAPSTYRSQAQPTVPYGGQEMRQGQAAPYRAGAQPPQADRWAGPSRALAPAAAPSAAEESIYAGAVPEAVPAPGPSINPPQNRWAPHAGNNQAPAPARSLYDPPTSAQLPPQRQPQIPPQRSAQHSYAPPAQSAQRTSAQFPAPRMVTASEAPPLSIDGFCPVTIRESTRWQKGSVNWGAVHRGRTYLFASPEAQRKFLADPDRYAPVLSGCDPVLFAETNQLISGSHAIGLLMGGQTFFFASEESLARFNLAPNVYMARAYQAMAAGYVSPR
jgi:YHS domain-containing protein/thiol-disulfide isomerase/thioredoxin